MGVFQRSLSFLRLLLHLLGPLWFGRGEILDGFPGMDGLWLLGFKC